VALGATWKLSSAFIPSMSGVKQEGLLTRSRSPATAGPLDVHAAPAADSGSQQGGFGTLGAAGGMVVLSSAALRVSRKHQKKTGRDAVQCFIFKRIASIFGGGGDKKNATLRDDWQKLADRAASVAGKNLGTKPAPKKTEPKKEKPAEISSSSGETLRDGWQELADKAVAVYASNVGTPIAKKAAAAPAPAAAVAAAAPAAAVEEKTTTAMEFDVFKPDTYGNITMEDVKKYGTAGTVAYVVTELAFWAIALPTEIAIFYQTAGRWPNFEIDADKAAVFGFVFAASNIARLCLPLRFGAALALAPWVDENIINPGKKSESTKEGA